MSQPPTATQQQQPASDDMMDVQQPQHQQQQQQEEPVQLSFQLNTDLNELSAINEEIARGTAHLRAVAKRGVLVYDMDAKFQSDMNKLREMSAEKQKKGDDHYALLKEQSGVDPARLKGWGKMMNSTEPEQQPARTAVHDLVCANAQLMEKVTTDLKRKHEEEKAEMQRQLDDLITKKTRYAPVHEQRREPPLQKAGISTIGGGGGSTTGLGGNAPYSLLNSVNQEVVSRTPMQNAAFKQTFLNPKVLSLERVPDYSATADQVLIAAQMAAKVQQIDSRRY